LIALLPLWLKHHRQRCRTFIMRAKNSRSYTCAGSAGFDVRWEPFDFGILVVIAVFPDLRPKKGPRNRAAIAD
jgi:hypothetical protein